MSVPFLDLSRVNSLLINEFHEAFDKLIGRSDFIMGGDVAAFEAEFAEWVGVRHAIGVSSGTDALLATLMALDVGAGDDVLVPAMTFFATAGTVARLGATPIFVDIDPSTMLMDVEQALVRRTENTKVVIPVHLFGQCVPIGALRDSGLFVIEDSAQAHGARNNEGQRTGAQGDVACFSFFPTKPLGGFGDGGMVTTDDDALASKIRLMRVHGARPKFHHLHVGGNFRLDTLQAALLRLKLPMVDAHADERNAIAEQYREGLARLAEQGVVQWVGRAPGSHVYHQLCARVSDRDGLRASLKSRGIGTGVYYPEPLHTQPCFADLNQGEGGCPHAEAACREVVALPCFSGLTEVEVAEVVTAINDFYAAGAT
jgi:dTDP-4-amino-4,6-dideoxygalactose transaminase